MSDDDAPPGGEPPAVALYLLYTVLVMVLIAVFVLVGVYGA